MAAAIRLPVNVSAPMITSNPIAVIVTRAERRILCRMYSEMPTRVAASAPSECESAVRCGTAVIGIRRPMVAPTIDPAASPTAIQR